MIKIGIIGLGVIGSACKYGFEKLGHKVIVHDIKLNTNIVDVISTDICYICVPTPSKDDGSCDTTIVEEVVLTLYNMNYKGVIAIKSTVKCCLNLPKYFFFGDVSRIAISSASVQPAVFRR